MTPPKARPKSITEYINAAPKEAQKKLREMRACIRTHLTQFLLSLFGGGIYVLGYAFRSRFFWSHDFILSTLLLMLQLAFGRIDGFELSSGLFGLAHIFFGGQSRQIKDNEVKSDFCECPTYGVTFRD